MLNLINILYSVFIKIFYIDKYSAFGKYSQCFTVQCRLRDLKMIRSLDFMAATDMLIQTAVCQTMPNQLNLPRWKQDAPECHGKSYTCQVLFFIFNTFAPVLSFFSHYGLLCSGI